MPHTSTSADSISGATRNTVLVRLGLPHGVPVTFDGLRALYLAWCRNIPFDNMQKIIALRANESGPLPGEAAEDFFANFLAHGTGATCWPSARAMFALLHSLGFDARRVGGSMLDMSSINHGSVKVAINGADWLVDTSILSDEPLPLGDALFENKNPVLPIEIERAEGQHVIWWYTPFVEPSMPCRLLVDHADDAMFRERYDNSRHEGPFNHRLHARRNLSGELLVVSGNMLVSRTAKGIVRTPLSRPELLNVLRERFGYSESVVSRWQACGGLEACFVEAPAPKAPPPIGISPSRRGR